jgi:hypothetical protein
MIPYELLVFAVLVLISLCIRQHGQIKYLISHVDEIEMRLSNAENEIKGME